MNPTVKIKSGASDFDKMMVSHADTVRRIGFAMLDNREDVDDFVQEVMMTAYSHRSQLRDTSHLENWMAVIARNTARRWNRKPPVTLVETLPERASPEPSAVECLEWNERRSRVRKIVNMLRPRDRELVESFYFNDATYDDLRKRFGMSFEAVGVRLFRARQRLRELAEGIGLSLAGFLFPPRRPRKFGELPMETSSLRVAAATTLCVAFIAGSSFEKLAGSFIWPEPDPKEIIPFVPVESAVVALPQTPQNVRVSGSVKQQEPDPNAHNTDILRRFIAEVVNKFDVTKVRAFLAPEAVFHFLERNGYRSDLSGYVARLSAHLAAFPDLKLELLRTVQSGDKVGSVNLITGTHTGEYAGIPATNKRFRIYHVAIDRFREGKIIEAWNYDEDAMGMRQIGVLPGPAVPVDQPITPSPKNIGSPMTPEEAVALHRRFFEECVNGRNFGLAAEMAGPEYVAHGLPVPEGETSANAARMQMETLLTAFPDANVTVEDAFSDGEYSVIRWMATGTHLGDLPNVPATGKSVKVGGIVIARVGGGKFHERWEAWDEAGMLKQIGVIK